MKNTVSLLCFFLLMQAIGLASGGVAAQSSAVDTLRWSWEVTTTVSTHTKTCTLDFQDSLWVDWGDGTAEWLSDTLSHKVISHVYPQPGNYACVAATNNLSYFKADSRRLLTLDPIKAPRLLYLSCTSSQLTSLDLSANTLLTTLYVGSNDLTQLDLTANGWLETVTCSDNQLTGLDLDGLPNLKKVTCHTNPLTTLTVHPTGALNYLSCGTCSLSTTVLDDLFAQLPTLATASTSQNLLFANNPGSETCQPAVAVAKNWTLEKVVTKSTVSIPTVSVKTGDTAVVALNLSNVQPVVAFEVDLLLPEGVVLDTVRTCLAPGRSGQHLLSVAKTSTTLGQYKVMAYSMTSKDTLKGREGAIVNLYLTTADTLRTYTLDLKKAVLVDTAATVLDVSLSDGKLTVLPKYTLGDADGDDLVNVTDIVWLVAAINGRPPLGFQAAASDMDENGQLNVADIVRIVDLIHAAVYTASMPAGCLAFSGMPLAGATPGEVVSRVPSSVRMHQVYQAAQSSPGNHLYLNQAEADPYTLHLCLDNSDVVQALQVDLVLPSGYALNQASLAVVGNRATKHTLSCLPVAGSRNRYRLLLWSMALGQTLAGKEGALLTCRLKAPIESGHSSVEADSLKAYVEEAVLTGDDLKTLPSTTYERPLSFQVTQEDASVEVGSDAPGQLWVTGLNLGRIQVFTPDGRLVQTTQGNGKTTRRLTLRPGLYLVEIERPENPRFHRKVLVS